MQRQPAATRGILKIVEAEGRAAVEDLDGAGAPDAAKIIPCCKDHPLLSLGMGPVLRQQYRLNKSPRRDPRVADFDLYALIDNQTDLPVNPANKRANTIHSWTLDQLKSTSPTEQEKENANAFISRE